MAQYQPVLKSGFDRAARRQRVAWRQALEPGPLRTLHAWSPPNASAPESHVSHNILSVRRDAKSRGLQQRPAMSVSRFRRRVRRKPGQEIVRSFHAAGVW